MRTGRTHQPLSYDVRLPDEAQAAALRLLDESRAVVNQALTILWPHLDEFGSERAGPAWKQVGKYIGSPSPHGDRQWRCESEVVGRLLRQQAARKKAFELVAPILSDGFIRPKTEKRPTGKNRPAIKEALTALQKSLEEDETSFVALQNVVEQACNCFFQHDCFPIAYEELQAVPLLKVGMLTYAGDDGREKGQAYRLAVAHRGHHHRLARVPQRAPAQRGTHGSYLARRASSRWGTVRGAGLHRRSGASRDARTRRQIDELKKKVARFEQERNALPEDHPKRAWYTQRLALYRRELERCWRKYEQRNRALAHLASNVLLLLCQVHGCSLLSMESLNTLKSTGRGRGVRGRWRNYCNNSTIRGEIWRLLRYKCHLVGLRFHTEDPRGTSHTCPHCGQPAKTYRSPSERTQAVKWGRWMYCDACHYNGDRDYCASVNLARLGVASLMQMKQSGKARSCSMTDPQVKPVSYTGAGAVLLLPPTGINPARHVRGKICYCTGWLSSAFLQSSQPKAVFLRLCG